MAIAADNDASSTPTLRRTCHLCEDAVDSHVWYAKTLTDDEGHPHRVYACPDCFFDLDAAKRETYYRERV